MLTDDFEQRFAPFTLECPRCLLPLVNTPLIEYTFEFLALNGIHEVFVYCSDVVEKYISDSRWGRKTSELLVRPIRSTATSVGDVMRDLDSRGVITGDFLLVQSDLVSNVIVLPALQSHRKRREKDKNAIMTMVLRRSEERRRAQETRPFFVIDSTKAQCVQYEELKPGRAATIEPQHLGNPQLEIREDLEDPHVDICTPDLLSLWSDNFDYTSLRSSFLRRVLKDTEETSHGKTIHTYIIEDSYAKRVQDLGSYDGVSKHVITRRTYPLCPETNMLLDQNYTFKKGGTYRGSNIALAQTSTISGRAVVGQDTALHEDAVVSSSTIGRRCQIGAQARIEGAYLWDDVRIGEGTNVKKALIASNAIIGRNCNIAPGALISFGVKIPDNSTITATSKLTNAAASSKRNSTTQSPRTGDTTGIFATDEYKLDSDTDQDGIARNQLSYIHPSASSSTSSFSVFSDEEDSDLELASVPSRTDSITSLDYTKTSSSAKRVFVEEATAGVLDMMVNDYTSEDLGMELNRDRMQANADPSEVRRAVASALVERISSLVIDVAAGTDSTSTRTGEVVKQVFARYGDVLKPWLSDGSKDQKRDQIDFLRWFQEASLSKQKGDNLLLFSLKELYDLEIVEEEGILQWWEGDEHVRQQSAAVEPFIAFLREAEEEESDDEAEESSEED